jgi:hypothetical protein
MNQIQHAGQPSIPLGLKELLPYPDQPWRMSDRIFKEMSQQPYNEAIPYKLFEIKSSDEEYPFILTYFNHSKPDNYHIKTVHRIHSPHLTEAFEANLRKLELKGEDFQPELTQDAQLPQREETLRKWEELVGQFYPIKIITGSNRVQTLFKTYGAPFWHGSSKPKCESIARSGFTYFGKHHFVHPKADKGKMGSTDLGYFGSGAYFTTSAKYASMYSNGHLMIAFGASNRPFPVVSDVLHPKKCSDMHMLETQGAYQTYNAHYIPVACVGGMEYFPCSKGQQADWDEIVFFQEVQVVPTYWVELEPDLLQMLPLNNQDYAKPAAGFNIVGICQHQACPLEGKKFVVQKGFNNLNSKFDLGEEYFNLTCTCCNSPTDLLDSVVAKDCAYSYEAVNKEEKKIQGKNPQLVGTEAWKVDGWKFMRIQVHPKK